MQLQTDFPQELRLVFGRDLDAFAYRLTVFHLIQLRHFLVGRHQADAAVSQDLILQFPSESLWI